MMDLQSNCQCGRHQNRNRSTMRKVDHNSLGHISFFFAVVLALLTILAGVTGVHINDLRVPRLIQNGTVEYVTLDCDYTIEDVERPGLVVKWFFKDEQSPVYQWIPNQRPKALGILKGKLNLEYKASPDAYKMYRALQIYRPSVNLSGIYLCRVSTFEGEAYKAASMIVFAPEKAMGIKVVDTRLPGYVNISCWASGVFPEPRLTLYHGENKDQRVDDMVVETKWNQGAYDIRAYKILEDANFSSSAFDCELSIPETDYVVRRSTFYEPGSFELRDGTEEKSNVMLFTYIGIGAVVFCGLLLASHLIFCRGRKSHSSSSSKWGKFCGYDEETSCWCFSSRSSHSSHHHYPHHHTTYPSHSKHRSLQEKNCLEIVTTEEDDGYDYCAPVVLYKI